METILDLTETNLNETETELHQTERKLNQTETKLNQTETKLNQTETKLTETNRNLADTTDRLNNTLHELRTKEQEAEECETRISGINCYRATNSSHWDILYTDYFYNKVITEELLEILDNSWEKLGKWEVERKFR